MKSSTVSLTTVLILILHGIYSTVIGQWQAQTIDDDFSSATIVRIADIDGDMDLDVAATSYGIDEVVWYENDKLTWTKRMIDDFLDGAIGLCLVDINGDEVLDVVSNGGQANDVVWYENNNLVWTKYIIDGNLAGAEFIDVGDMDNDGDPDVVACGWQGPIAWYENLGGSEISWKKHPIDFNIPGAPTSIAVGDIDNDDTLDVVVNLSSSGDVVWFSNKNVGRTWTMYTIDNDLDGSWHVSIADLDGDDILDVVATGEDANHLVWYENLGGSPVDWKKDIIDENLPGARTAEVADIDDDGKLDILASGRNSDEVVWYRNNLPDWEKFVVDDDLGGVNHVFPGDINGDNRLDIAAAGWLANKIVWYQNLLDVAHAISVHSTPGFIPFEGDSLIINSTLYNPDQNSVTVKAVITNDQSTFRDSLELYDDGQHNDNLALDNIWGNSLWYSGLDEDVYNIAVSTYDQTEEYFVSLNQTSAFTTMGPILYKSYWDTLKGFRKSEYNIYPSLHNYSTISSVKDVTATIEVISTEGCFDYVIKPTCEFAELAPGQTAVSITPIVVQLKMSEDCPENGISMNFRLHIAIGGVVFWIKEFSITDLEDIDLLLPQIFTLEQNYPNPFNPVTMINYQLPMINDVELSIYNLLGQKVAILVNERQQAGHHQVEWDASGFASGVYYYRIQAGEFVDVKKMILIR